MQLVLEGFSSIGQILKELLILLGFDFTLGLGPERLDQVDCLSVDRDGEVDEVGVFLDDLLDFCLLQELFGFLFDVQDNLGASDEGVIFCLTDGEGA